MGEGTVFSLFVSPHLRGGGYPISGLGRGVPHPRSGQGGIPWDGVPPPGPGIGYPLDMGQGTPSPLDLGWGTPPDLGRGTHPDLGWGTPPDLGQGTQPPRDLGWGTPPEPGMGYPPPPG